MKNVVLENGGTEKFQYSWKKPVLEKGGSLYWKMLVLIVAILKITTKILNFFQAGSKFWVKVCL